LELNSGFSDLLSALNDAAEYLVVGVRRGARRHPRATKDLDVFVRATAENANKRASGRPQDLADVDALEKLARRG